MSGKTKTIEIELERRRNISLGLKYAYATGLREPNHMTPPNGFKEGHIPWNKGKNKVQSYDNRCSNCNKFGMKDKSHLCKTGNFGKHHTEETKLKLREARSHLIIPFKDTKIEIITENWLKENNITYEKHKLFYLKENRRHQVDFYIPLYDIVIECDGDYWHSLPRAKKLDPLIDSSLN